MQHYEIEMVHSPPRIDSDYLLSFNEDWNRLDETTDSDGDLLPDMEIKYGLNRHSAAVLGTALK